MDNKSVVGIVLVFLGITVFLGLYGFSMDQPGHPISKTGEWNLVFSETVSYDRPDEYVKEYHEIDSHVMALNLEWIEKKMFSGEYDGIPIVGGLVGNDISFEVCDREKQVFLFVDGTFYDTDLFLSIISFTDETMNIVKEGIFAQYVHGNIATVLPADSMPDFNGLNPMQTEGTYNYMSNDGNLISTEYQPSDFEVVSQGAYIATIHCDVILNPLVPGESITLLCVFNEILDGTTTLLIYGSSDGQAFSGKMIVGGNKLSCFLFGKDDATMAITSVTCNVNHPAGNFFGSTDVSGSWSGNIYYSYGEFIEVGDASLVKDFIFVNPCFGSIELMDSELFKWIGISVGDRLHLLAEHMGRHYSLFGEVIGEKMHVCGYYLDEFDRYRAVYYELTLES